MLINETNALSTTLTVKNSENKDIVVVFVNTNLNTNLNNFSINAIINDLNKDLLTASATNLEGFTIAEQYKEFEVEIKRRAKEMGYLLF